jgi:hypothetical protein
VSTSKWPDNDLRRTSYVLPIPAELTPGEYELMLTLSDQQTGEPVGDTAVLGNVFIHPISPLNATSVMWENRISLLGHDVAESAGNLNVILNWQAERPLQDSYKVFLHIQDVNSGEILAQSDTIPRNWTYPTTGWQPGEIVRDVITVPLDSLPEGSYRLMVGLYDEQTGERLLLVAPDGDTQQNAFMLTNWER